jgi:hypothetical protein
MTSYSLSPIVARKATERGALDGFQCECSCGLTLRSSLRTILVQDALDHAAYHARPNRRAMVVRDPEAWQAVAAAGRKYA